TKVRVEPFRKMKNKTGPAVAEMLDFFERFDVEKYGSDGGPLHDPCVVAWLLHPEMFTGKLVNVEIECESELTMGQTVVDWWRVTTRPHNTHFVRGLDADAFFKLLTERLTTLA
ncbi:MAG: nucleoside hydrolase, partial [Aestuariivirga sp.]